MLFTLAILRKHVKTHLTITCGRAKAIWPDWSNLVPDCPIDPDWKCQSGKNVFARLEAHLAFFVQSGFEHNLAFGFFPDWSSFPIGLFFLIAPISSEVFKGIAAICPISHFARLDF